MDVKIQDGYRLPEIDSVYLNSDYRIDSGSPNRNRRFEKSVAFVLEEVADRMLKVASNSGRCQEGKQGLIPQPIGSTPTGMNYRWYV